MEQAGEKPLAATVTAQLQSRVAKTTKNNKPYLNLTFADATGNFSIKVWSDSDVYQRAEILKAGEVILLEGKWTQGAYGMEAKDLGFVQPKAADLEHFHSGDPVLKAKQDADFEDIVSLCESIGDPRMKSLCAMFLAEFGERFRRTAAAKKNHHARRGGLVEHTAQMMRSANALCPVYPEWNRDLLLTGVLFHDSGKLWENSYPKQGFTQILSDYGEMLGHIPLGIELVNKLWNDLIESGEAEEWRELSPATEKVRLHILHLIGSHHGEMAFGSPVLPRTPEAFALHYIDNLDAKMEMVREAYGQSQEIAPGIYDRVFPLPANLLQPLGEIEVGGGAGG